MQNACPGPFVAYDGGGDDLDFFIAGLDKHKGVDYEPWPTAGAAGLLLVRRHVLLADPRRPHPMHENNVSRQLVT